MAQASRDQAAAPQFSFYLSSDIGTHVQLRIQKLSGRIPAYEDPELAPGGSVRPSSLFVAATLCDEHGTLSIPSQTHYAEAEEDGCAWDSLLTFVLKYRDLGPTSQLALTVWEVREGAATPRPLGGATLRLFSKKGGLKTGRHALQMWIGRQADGGVPTSTPGKSPASERGRAGHVERALKKFERGEFEAVPWLDALAVKAARDFLATEAEATATAAGRDKGGCSLRLVVDVPSFPLSVLYRDSALPAAAPTALPAAADGTESASTAAPVAPAAAAPAPGSPIPASYAAARDALSRSLGSGTGRILLIHDPEVGKESPAEVKAQKLARSTGRGLLDAGLRPNTVERAKIDAALALPPGSPLSREDRELLWRFRFALVGEGRALPRFLKCVDWSDAAEAAQAGELMGRWANISVAQALELLSPDYPVEAVRAHAVAALGPTSDAELLLFLLQLMQALRYEPVANSRLAAFLVARARRSAAVASALFWYLCAELEDPVFGERATQLQGALLARDGTSSPSAVPEECLPLQMNLVARLRHLAEFVRAQRSADRKTEELRNVLSPGRACGDLATFECPCPLDPAVRLKGIVPEGCSVFKSKVNPIKITFRVELPEEEQLGAGEPSAAAASVAAATATTAVAQREESASALPARLASINLGRLSEDEQQRTTGGGGGGGVASPWEALRSHSRQQRGSPSPPAAAAGAANAATAATAARSPSSPLSSSAATTATLALIYKRGDDLRQDQLVLQMISLMDRLLKREHLDLRITAYQVLPTSATDGLIEFVPSSLPLSQVLRAHGSVHRFLARHHPNPKGPYGLDPGVLANYVRSCAGSVVVTHILGIGDRHMDNIMLTTDGRLFHIDFGYVLGRDPKFSTAPLVLNRAMVDGMGGAEGPHYRQFVQLCGEAYNILRKSANLLLSLVHLMAGSSIPDIRSDPEKALLKVQERLLLELDDEAAAAAMERMVVAAQAAVLPRFAEVQHRVAQGWR